MAVAALLLTFVLNQTDLRGNRHEGFKDLSEILPNAELPTAFIAENDKCPVPQRSAGAGYKIPEDVRLLLWTTCLSVR
jgi:hypothetical protein